MTLAPQGVLVGQQDALKAAGDPRASLHGFTLDMLAEFKREGSFAPGDSEDFRVFYVGRDDVHGVLKFILARCTRMLKLNMFGYDDDELNTIIQSLVEDQHVYVQGTLDRSQAGGAHERKILETWAPGMRASFAVGQSATHQISHTKGGVVDGVVGFEGSTNWSASGEGAGIALGGEQHPGFKAQNNTLAVYVNPVEIVQFGTELDQEHATALRQEAARSASQSPPADAPSAPTQTPAP